MAIKTRQTTADGVTNKGAPLTNDELDNNFVELTQGKVDASGDTMTGDLNFGDNDKAVFGAGSDLQIYHDASGQSYIREVGTGGLNIEGTNMTFRDQTGTELYATFTANGQVVLYYDNSAKLATTSTGVDVTGTVTADGLTASTSGNQVMLLDSTAGGATLQMRTASGSLSNYLRSGLGGSANLRFETTGNVVRQKIDENGDISFYDSTGVSQSFYWDASAESLGIGTTTPDGIFESTGGRSYLRGSDENYTLGIGRGGNTGNYFLGATASSSPDLLFSNNAGTTNVVFTNGGNVGIGTNSPDAALSVIGTTQSGTGANNNTLGSAISLSGLGASQPLMAMRWTGLSHSGISGSNYTSQIVIDSANSNVTELYNTGATPLVFGTNATERMRIDSSGNLLVGNTVANPASGFSTQKGFGYAGATGKVEIATTADNAVMEIGKNNANDGDLMVFRKQGTSVGSIGTGGTRLHIVNGDTGLRYAGNNDAIWPCGANGSDRDNAIDLGVGSIRFKDLYLSGGVSNPSGALTFDTGGSERMRIDSSGNVLVGMTSLTSSAGISAYKLNGHTGRMNLKKTYSGTTTAVGFYHNNVGIGTITYSNTATSYNTSSDYRLKEDWQPMVSNFDRVSALKPVNFAWKLDGSRVDGFLAHELADVVPEAVTGTKDAMTTEEYEVTPAVLDDEGNVVTEAVMGEREVPDYQAIDQSKLVPLLTAALQDAIAEIETLKADVAQLKGTN